MERTAVDVQGAKNMGKIKAAFAPVSYKFSQTRKFEELVTDKSNEYWKFVLFFEIIRFG